MISTQFLKIKIANSTFFELTCYAIVMLAQFLLGHFLQGFGFFNSGYNLRLFAIILSVMPVITAYTLIRFLFPPLLSTVMVSATLTIISIMNHVKTSLTNIPISFSDLINTGNISIVAHYITPTQVILIIGFLIILGFAFKINTYRKRTNLVLVIQVVVLLLSLPLTLIPHIKIINVELDKKVSFYLNSLGSRYMSFDWVSNVKENGLPVHLIQTSVSSLPDEPSEENLASFNQLLSTESSSDVRPSHIIFILCEACWHDTEHFNQPFSQLTELGFREFRAVSPSYGGNTVNASFELHTGLPANGILPGVIYTEYSSAFSDHVDTFPQHLKKVGYKTIVAHNHIKTFWRRNIIKPKLGFDKFVSIEDMNYHPDQSADSHAWVNDKVLFDSALKELEEKDTKKYLFLITVYTHGSYVAKNDFGESDYYHRLTTSVTDIADFAKNAIKNNPDTLIFIVGDHKPALTRFFYENKIIPKENFNQSINNGSELANHNEDFLFATNASNAVIGDVPAYIYHPDKLKTEEFIKKANGKPFFCVSQILNEEFANVQVPVFWYTKNNGICERYEPKKYKATVKEYPGWLYYMTLFNEH